MFDQLDFQGALFVFVYLNVLISVNSQQRLFYTKGFENIQVHEGGVSNDDQWIARGYFDNKINKTGFSFLELETNANFSNEKQAQHAGFLEGYLTSDLIFSQWYNVIDYYCKRNTSDNCIALHAYIKRNTRWIRLQKYHFKESYWHQVGLYYTQVEGMYRGYNYNRKQHQRLTWQDIWLLNLQIEMQEVQNLIDWGCPTMFSKNEAAIKRMVDHCSVLIKVMPNNQDIYFGHNSWMDYQHMLRIIKRYVLHFTRSMRDGEIIPGYEMTFSSYPGTISSNDDFYLTSSGLAITETTNHVFDKLLYYNYTVQNIVWTTVRSMVANRLATGGRSWYNTFKRYNSGTYNNQWMVLKYKKFIPGQNLPNNSLWIIEQMPTIITKEDVTDVLREKGYWASFNVPYTQEIFNVSGYRELSEKNGSWYSYTNNPRRKIFERDHIKVKDLNSFMSFMRSNNYPDESLAKCDSQHPNTAGGAIAARKDLNNANGFGVSAKECGGAIDAKITNFNLFKRLQFRAVSGPTTGTDKHLPVFSWSKCDYKDIPHLSQPDTFNFEPILHNWILVCTRQKDADNSTTML